MNGQPSPWEEMISQENEILRARVADLEKKVETQSDEIACLRSTLAGIIRRLNTLEMPGTSHSRGSQESSGNSSKRTTQSRVTHSPAHRPVRTTPSPSRSRTTPSPTYRPASASSKSNGSSKHWDNDTSVGSPAGSVSPARKEPMSLHALSPRALSPTGRSPTGHGHSLGSSPTLSERAMSPHRGSAGSLFRPFYTSHFKGPAREPVYHPDDGYLRMYLRGRAINFFSPSDLTEYEVRSPLPAPDDKLRLEWVYGYRGKDSRNNLLLLPTGEIVYYIASVVVLYSAADHSQRHYLAHTAEVKCMTLHPNKTVIATGQAAGVDRRERVYLYNKPPFNDL